MNVILNINDLCESEAEGFVLAKQNIHFLDKKRNIIMDGEFTKIIFSDELITINGFYILCNMQFHISSDKNVLNKNILYFQPYHSSNIPLLKIYSELEKQILDYYKECYGSVKTPVYSLHNQLHSGNVRIYKSFNATPETSLPPPPPPGFSILPKQYSIKISGIWETDRNIGITYKFLETKRKKTMEQFS